MKEEDKNQLYSSVIKKELRKLLLYCYDNGYDLSIRKFDTGKQINAPTSSLLVLIEDKKLDVCVYQEFMLALFWGEDKKMLEQPIKTVTSDIIISTIKEYEPV